jgi:succinyl-diaminopimelate desuccinylase
LSSNSRIDGWIEGRLDEMVRTTIELIRVDTSVPPGRNYAECASVIKETCEKLGLKTEIRYIAEDRFRQRLGGRLKELEGPRPNVIARLGQNPVWVLLNGHIDVVPAQDTGWTSSPFSPTIRDGRIYGRGAADMKGSLAAMTYAAAALVHAVPELERGLTLTYTTDEEVGGYTGIEFLIEEGIINSGYKYCISTDGDIEYISVAGLGDLEVRIDVRGKAEHSGQGWLGVNAVEEAAELIVRLKDLAKLVASRRSKIRVHPSTGVEYMRPGLYVNVIRGGLKANIIPDHCHFVVDRRFIPEEDQAEVLEELLRVIRDFKEAKPRATVDASVESSYPAYAVDPGHELVRALRQSAAEVLHTELPLYGSQGSSDVAFIAALGIPVVSLGAARPDANYHAQNENVRIQDLEYLAKILARCLLRLTGQGGVG